MPSFDALGAPLLPAASRSSDATVFPCDVPDRPRARPREDLRAGPRGASGPRRRGPRRPRRRARRRRRPVGLGQVDAAAPRSARSTGPRRGRSRSAGERVDGRPERELDALRAAAGRLRLPVLPPRARAHAARRTSLLAARLPGAPRRRRWRAAASSSSASGWPTPPAGCRTSSPAASSSASRSPARSSTTRRSCSPTSRRATSIPRPARDRARRCCATAADEGRAVVARHPRGGRDRRRRPRAAPARRRARRMRAAFRGRSCCVRAGGRRCSGGAGVCSPRRCRGRRSTVAFGAGDGLRPLGAGRRPARRHRPLRPRARRRGSTRLCAALPNVEARSYRIEVDRRAPAGGDRPPTRRGAVQLVDRAGRRGYAVVAGRDLPGRGRRGRRGARRRARLAPAPSATRCRVGRLGTLRVVGSPSPRQRRLPARLAAARLRVRRLAAARDRRPRPARSTSSLLWTRDPSRTDVTLQQARAT